MGNLKKILYLQRKPITNILKYMKLIWSYYCEDAFRNTIIISLTSAQYGIGAVVIHMDCVDSRTVNQEEENHSQLEKVVLAIIFLKETFKLGKHLRWLQEECNIGQFYHLMNINLI